LHTFSAQNRYDLGEAYKYIELTLFDREMNMFTKGCGGETMMRGGNRRSLSTILAEIDITLTSSSKTAASIGDELLVYLIDMAILHVRTRAVNIAPGSTALRILASELSGLTV
jgi:hypothetical protein